MEMPSIPIGSADAKGLNSRVSDLRPLRMPNHELQTKRKKYTKMICQCQRLQRQLDTDQQQINQDRCGRRNLHTNQP